MSKRLFLCRLLASLGIFAGGQVQAMTCSVVSSPQFTFGQYDPLSPVALDVQASFLMQCIPTVPGEMLNLQVSLAEVMQPLQLQNIQTGEWLRVSLYTDAARTRPIDSQQVLAIRIPLFTSTLLSLPVYGRIPARQGISVGTYRMNFSVILDF